MRACFGGFAKAVACGLIGRHNDGSQYMADAFRNELDFLGTPSSFAAYNVLKAKQVESKIVDETLLLYPLARSCYVINRRSAA